jgi:predicted O-methyltransferase YrrM
MDIINTTHIQHITQILLNIGERVEGNLLCDIDPNNWVYEKNKHKIQNLQNLSKGAKKIMEIGVNACHSLIIMLLQNPSADYLLFDLNYHRYTEPIINYVKGAFPDTNIKIVYGNSIDTISKYILDNQDEINTYDLIHLDGGHTEDIFSYDYDNSKRLLKPDGVVIFDDYDYGEIKRFIDKKVSENEIIEYKNTNLTKTATQFIYKHFHALTSI